MNRIIYISILLLTLAASTTVKAQVNTEQVIRIGQNALYYEDYMLSIQYFNQAITSRPDLATPYFMRSIAKLNLDDYQGAENDATLALERNKFIVDAWEVRGVARQNMGKLREAIEDYTQALILLPNNKNILFNRALAQLEEGDTVGAAESYATLIRHNPSYENGYIGRARLYLAQNDTASALADLDRAISLNKLATNAYILRADISFSSATPDYDRALADLDQAIKLQPRQASLFVNRAFVRYKLDDYFGAMADYDYALQLDPLNSAALFNRGVLRSEVHDNDKAINDFSEFLRINPNDGRALYNRALLYHTTHQWQRALNDINKVIQSEPSLPTAWFLRSDIYRNMGNHAKSNADFDKGVAVAKSLKPDEKVDIPSTPIEDHTSERFATLLTIDNTSDPLQQDYHNPGIRGKVQDRNIKVEYLPMFVLSYYAPATELRESTYFIKEVDEINDTHILPNVVMITNSEVPLNDPEEIERHFASIKQFKEAIAQSPRPIDYFGLAMAQSTVHDYDGATQSLTKLLELTPDLAAAYLQRGVVKYRQLSSADPEVTLPADTPPEVVAQMMRSRMSQVFEDFDTASRLAPHMAYAYYNKGVVLLDLNDLTSALSAFTKAIEIMPNMGEAYYNRGYVYLKLGNLEAGTADLSKAGELGILPSYNLIKRIR
ncbi:MAG: tetratricopeptide repeat protein [Muribaculaceae bacterium]|nr:tetratricopeptide repeat protein [Muribaculaceae bacterium]